jgi:RecB family exonuclease
LPFVRAQVPTEGRRGARLKVRDAMLLLTSGAFAERAGVFEIAARIVASGGSRRPVDARAARAVMRRVAPTVEVRTLAPAALRSWSLVDLALEHATRRDAREATHNAREADLDRVALAYDAALERGGVLDPAGTIAAATRALESGGVDVAAVVGGASEIAYDPALDADPLAATFVRTLVSAGAIALAPCSVTGDEPASSVPLLAFARDALAYAAHCADALAIRLLDSPFSGIERDDARALIVAARDREAVRETIATERVPLSRETLLAARRFVAALDATASALRAQGTGAHELVAATFRAFDLERQADEGEAATMRELLALGGALDVARACTVDAWEPAELIDLIDHCPAPHPRARDCSEVLARPLGAREPEAAPPVPRRKGHQSASSLGTFAECERKWFYRYACAAVEDRGSSASVYGSAFHWALERFHGEFPRGDSAPAEVLERKLDSYVTLAFERYRLGFPTTVEFELQKRRAKRTAKRYLAWFLERSRAHPFEVIGRETEADVEIDGYRFIGYIDRLDRDDRTGNVTVVDYKTGWIAQSASEYRANIARFVDFQLPFYYWARTLEGDRVTRLALVPLKDAQLDVRPIELEVVPIPAGAGRDDVPTGLIGIDELERARKRMVELAHVLADEDVGHFGVTSDPNACTYCAYLNACRDRPRRREDRFGR